MLNPSHRYDALNHIVQRQMSRRLSRSYQPTHREGRGWYRGFARVGSLRELLAKVTYTLF